LPLSHFLIARYWGLNKSERLTAFFHATFDSVTFMANLNHIPKSQRDIELSEAYRVLKPKGNIIVTMGNPLAEIAIHKVVWLYDKLFGTNYDMDSERGMGAEEDYYLTDGNGSASPTSWHYVFPSSTTSGKVIGRNFVPPDLLTISGNAPFMGLSFLKIQFN